MTQRDNKRLFDIATRTALFVEGVKLGQMALFNSVLRELNLELRKLLGRVNHKTLDGLTKAELNHLLLTLRKSQSKLYSAYIAKLIGQLQEFMQLRLDVAAVSYASIKQAEPQQLTEASAYSFIEQASQEASFSPIYGLSAIMPSGEKSLWSTIKNAPIPANGLLLLPFISAFSRSAQGNIENTIRKAYANRESVQELIEQLAGKPAVNGNSTQLAKIAKQAAAVIELAFGHVDQQASQAVASALFEHYRWVSIIDDGTTPVCRSRNNHAFKFGKGPIPPAHYGCRSITIPLASLFSDFDSPTLYAWLKNQPREIQQEYMGIADAERMEAGKISSKQFATLKIVRVLTLDQFKSKLGLIILT